MRKEKERSYEKQVNMRRDALRGVSSDPAASPLKWGFLLLSRPVVQISVNHVVS
jgi:hypothetical protein